MDSIDRPKTRLVSSPGPYDWRKEIYPLTSAYIDQITEMIDDIVRQTTVNELELMFAEESSYLFFPVEWVGGGDWSGGGDGVGNPEVDDPLTVYVRLGSEYFTEALTLNFNLREALEETLDDCRHHGSFDIGMSRLAVALRALADEIESAVVEGKRNAARRASGKSKS